MKIECVRVRLEIKYSCIHAQFPQNNTFGKYLKSKSLNLQRSGSESKK